MGMKIVSWTTLAAFAEKHPEARASLTYWRAITKAAKWQSTNEVQATFPKAKVINGERVRFEIVGNTYRMVIAFDFRGKTVYVKFIGTHTEYDRVDAKTVSMF